MDYIIKTYKGIDFTIGADEISLESFQKDLNNRTLLVISIGPIVMNKNNIKIVVSETQPIEGPNVYTLTTTDGGIYKTEIEDYVASDITASLNSGTKEFVVIGNILINRNNFDVLQ